MDRVPIRKNAGFRRHSGAAPETSCRPGRLYHTTRYSRRPAGVAVVFPAPLDALQGTRRKSVFRSAGLTRRLRVR